MKPGVRCDTVEVAGAAGIAAGTAETEAVGTVEGIVDAGVEVRGDYRWPSQGYEWRC